MSRFPTRSSLAERAEPESALGAVVYVALGLLALLAASGLGTSLADASDLASHAVSLVAVGLIAAGCYGIICGAGYWDNLVSTVIGMPFYLGLLWCALAAVVLGLLIVVEGIAAFFSSLP